MSRRDFNRLYRAAVLENEYMTRRNLSAWEIMVLENDGLLNWRARPDFVTRRLQKEILTLQGQEL